MWTCDLVAFVVVFAVVFVVVFVVVNIAFVVAELKSFGNSTGPAASAATALAKGAATATTYTGFACFSTQFAKPLAEVDPDAWEAVTSEDASRAANETDVLVLSHKRLDKLCKKSATKPLCVRLHIAGWTRGCLLAIVIARQTGTRHRYAILSPCVRAMSYYYKARAYLLSAAKSTFCPAR